MTRYDIVPDASHLWIDAQSSLHPVHVEASGLEGHVEAAFDDEGNLDLGTSPEAQFELDVDKLKSGNKLIDRETERRVDVRKHPKIKGELANLEAVDDNRYRAEGDLSFHGVTKRVEGEMTISQGDDSGTIVIEGEQQFDVRDFDLQPPKLAMLKVHPDVTARARIVAKAAE